MDGVPQFPWASVLDVGLGAEEKVPSVGSHWEHHGSAPAICSLLPRELSQAPSISLHELWEKAPGEGRCSQARLELQVAEGVTEDMVICAFLGEMLGP